MPEVWEPSEEMLVQAQYYICHERHYFHRYRILRDCPNLSLFFMDRWYDWQYESSGDVPMISRYNGLMEIACRESWAEEEVPLAVLPDRIRRAFDRGSHITVPVAFVHSDGTPYVTEWLLEGIDADDTVYYTKSTSDAASRTFRKPVAFEKLADQLFRTDDGLVAVTEIKAAPTIERILSLEPMEAYRAVFAEYGLRWEGGRLSRYVTPVTIGVTGMDQLIEAWQERAEEILVAGELRFNDQSRVSKHLQNRFHPVQHYLGFLLESPETNAALGDLASDVRRGRDDMGRALSDVLKFASLLVQRTDSSSLGLYLKYLRNLRETVVDYQALNLRVQRALA
ncbi:hypothetical protein ACFVVA_10510 [Kitasatospora sp. NPDC058048]|uniref:hypothetical protein n=1 Tax=Kitasatospora sp. NPDC058048 TaxID=3346313 RepID=UPI0036DE42FC